ncbi:RHS repeat domain-containing protein [Chryseobacterium sp. JM1]|uniref:RHS repeat domain-containing protein n=1 Tax=Chryseobacterium sp. JM1 TaxID=1233950 RepID=UPI0009DEF9D3|nr:RHS repeat-associated core domain-containing protein [Chryseobacterium sp. JM1]
MGYAYEGNRLISVTDAIPNFVGYVGGEMKYDENGNMTKNPDKEQEISYNFLNLPSVISIGTGRRSSFVNYMYRADGVKLRKDHNTSIGIVTTDYLDGFQYAPEPACLLCPPNLGVLQFVPTSEGYFDFIKNKYIYNYADHLGNTRVSYMKGSSGIEVIAENNYYPFGLQHEGYNIVGANPQYQYKYNGKELQTESGMYDYGARFYMADLGRWGVVDPLAEKMRRYSPYNYAFNNPIRFIDPDGRQADDFVKRKDGSIYWDKNANNQATTKSEETYLGKELTFKFNSYIDAKRWDGPNSKAPGDKLTSTVILTARENDAGELTRLVGEASYEVGSTPIGTARDYYPGEGGNNNVFNLTSTSTGINVNYEQHASVSWQEESGMNLMGFKIVDVAQKLDINYNSSNGNLSVEASTNIFPSANLTVSGNGNTSTLMQYNQPSFPGTHRAPDSKTERNYGRGGVSTPRKDFSYYPSRFYKRN